MSIPAAIGDGDEPDSRLDEATREQAALTKRRSAVPVAEARVFGRDVEGLLGPRRGDEVVGFLITMVWLPLTWQSLLLGFVLFRFFDIVKPPPIRQLDQHVKGGFGVMIDDIAAGLISSVILQIIYTQTSWLGVQISTLTSS